MYIECIIVYVIMYMNITCVWGVEKEDLNTYIYV